MALGAAGALLLMSATAPASAAVRGEPVQLAAVPQPLPDGKSFVFVWAGDIWHAPIRGGKARSLTRHPAEDHWPCVSADGRQVAFSSKRDDASQVYVMPIEGGTPRRLTYHSEGATPLAWFPDGLSILVRAGRDEPGVMRGNRFLKVATDGSGVETLLFDAYVGDADLSPDGTKILFTREGEDLYRKGYRGSNASQLWLYDIPSATFQRVRNDPGGDRSPMWRPDGKGFYYVSQVSGCQNLWEQDLPSGNPRQLTHFTDAPVIVPRIARDGSVVMFRHLFDFYRLDPRGGAEPQKVKLTAATDIPRERVRRRWYTGIWNNDSDGTLDWTADGLQMCFTAGGDLWVMDTVLREPVQVTRESGIHETEAVFAPDGKSIYVLRDTGDRANIWQVERAEAELPWWRNQKFKLTQLTRDDSGKYGLKVSPTGSKIAYCAARGDVYVADAKGQNPVCVLASQVEVSYDWSPDGKWLSCDVSDDFENRDVWIVSATGARAPYNVSRHPNWDGGSRWSPDGRRLAFVGRRYDDTTDLYYVNLRRDDEDSTKRDRTIEDAMAKMKPAAKPAGSDTAKPAEPAAGDVVIDFADLSERIHRIDMKGGVPSNLFWSYDSKALAFNAVIDGRGGTYKVVFPDNLKPDFMTDRRGTQGRWIQRDSTILWMVDRVPAHFSNSFGFTALQETVVADYRRLGFRLIWRTLRDRFYDGRLNNLDWPAMLARYEDAAANAPDNATFQRVALMLLGELNSSHMDFTLSDNAKKEWGDEWKSRNWTIRTGHTGLLFDRGFSGPGLKVKSVLTNGPTDRDASRVRPGETVLEINGTAVNLKMDWARLLTGVFPRDDRLLVADPKGSNRVVTVRTIGYEEARDLLREDSLDQMRKRVDQLSQGHLGYLHVAKMQWEDLRRFEQEVYARGFDKDGLVIDVRGNTGGFVADRLLAILCQPMHATTIPRGGGPSYPSGYLGKVVWTKPLTVLCDQDTASNGEIFSHAIKTLRRGAVVGVPTQGSVISTGEADILDLGTLRVPNRGWFVGPTGMDMEVSGCVPDFVVEKTPADEVAGADPQLDKAVEVLLKAVSDEQSKPKPKLIPASEVRATKPK